MIRQSRLKHVQSKTLRHLFHGAAVAFRIIFRGHRDIPLPCQGWQFVYSLPFYAGNQGPYTL